MKIGIDCRLWNETGVGRYIRNLVLELSKIDNENKYVLFVRLEDYTQVKSSIVNDKWSIVTVNIRWHSLSEQLSFTKILNNQNLDLVHFPYFSHPVFYNRPFVITIHDLILNHFPTGRASTLPLPMYYLKRFFYNRVLDHATNKSEKIIVPLEFVKNDLIKTLGVSSEKIVVTKEGFDLSISKGDVSEKIKKISNCSYFLYVGNAYPHKNLEILLAAFKDLPNLKLILVGRDDFFYKRFELKKSQNIIFLHDVSDSELFHLYSNSIGAVSASLMEGFGLLPLEAFGAGTIPIVSDIPAFREVCSDKAIYFDPKDSDDIAGKLQYVDSLSKSEREKLIREGINILKKFSWRKMAEETLKVYESAV